MQNNIILIRGAGDLATGTIVRLVRCGYLVAALETEKPTSIRRSVSLSECMFDKYAEVEGVKAVKVDNVTELLETVQKGLVPVLSDKDGLQIKNIKPRALIDAIIAKRNLGTNIAMANVVLALGPGFCASKDCHAVIETKRGHNLGRVILNGEAAPNSGQPGNIEGFTTERVIKSPSEGSLHIICDIGSIVNKGDVICSIEKEGKQTNVFASISGKLRGMLREQSFVPSGFKIADIDPRGAIVDEKTISDKARSIAGGVLEALLYFGVKP